MKYAVLTTKHHDGFCLFDSKYTDYKATNTPAHRDLVREYVNAFRAQGMKIGFYYSLLDWHHPDYTMDDVHPLTQTDTSQANYDRLNKGRDMRKYRQYLRDQITELLTNYGKIDVLWLDWTWGKDATAASMPKMMGRRRIDKTGSQAAARDHYKQPARARRL
jgi:alpha-L-fucosidase